jgi:dipeptidyl aminopeptidase/acylaminoacyl peptidase
VYPGQDHGLSQPAYARDVIKRYLSWYERWLKPAKW